MYWPKIKTLWINGQKKMIRQQLQAARKKQLIRLLLEALDDVKSLEDVTRIKAIFELFLDQRL